MSISASLHYLLPWPQLLHCSTCYMVLVCAPSEYLLETLYYTKVPVPERIFYILFYNRRLLELTSFLPLIPMYHFEWIGVRGISLFLLLWWYLCDDITAVGPSHHLTNGVTAVHPNKACPCYICRQKILRKFRERSVLSFLILVVWCFVSGLYGYCSDSPIRPEAGLGASFTSEFTFKNSLGGTCAVWVHIGLSWIQTRMSRLHY